MKVKTLSIALLMALFATTSFAQNILEETVYFEYDQSNLTLKSVTHLSAWLEDLSNREFVNITISGHTDLDGSEEYNEGLSERRATSVKDYLVQNGIEGNKIVIQHFGEQNPIISGENDAEKFRNRRVTLEVKCPTQIPKEFTGTYQEFRVIPGADTSIELDKKGTILHISAYSFIDQTGKGIHQPVTIRYKEYRNSADMAFSQIPMNYKENGTEYCFNSSGMFEIYGMYKNEAVVIAKGKSLVIDYALARQNQDIAFYQLNDDNNNWKKIQDIQPLKVDRDFDEEAIEGEPRFGDGRALKPRWLIHIGKLKLFRLKGKRFLNQRRIQGWEPIGGTDNKQAATLLAEGANVGHTYPDIVKGLNVGSFGVYNCDQAYRMKNRSNILASYVDENGNPIANQHVLSMMDLNYNGAFSFDPDNFTCDVNGKNALALFTHDKELYILEPKEFAKLNLPSGQQEQTFTMKNVTQEITTTKELAAYLGIDQ